MSDKRITTVVNFKEEDFSHLLSMPTLEIHSMGQIYAAANTDLAAAAMDREEKYNGIKSIIERGRISSYRMIEEELEILLYLTNRLDANIVLAGIYPRKYYKTDFHQANEQTKKDKLEEQLRSLRSVFNHTSLKDKVFFELDWERRTIVANTRNGDDFVDLFGQSRRMKIHQRILSTPDPAVSLRF